MTTHQQNRMAIQEGQQGGPAQKKQAVQGGMGAERDLNAHTGVQRGDQDLPPPQQQAELNPKQLPKELMGANKESGDTSPAGGNYNPGGQAGKTAPGEHQGDKRPKKNPGQTGTPGGKDKQDAPQNQKR